jgi:hypothetical protein
MTQVGAAPKLGEYTYNVLQAGLATIAPVEPLDVHCAHREEPFWRDAYQ